MVQAGARDGGGNGRMNEIDKRLFRIETLLESAATREDIASLQATLKHAATKDDISRVKIWVLIGAFTALAVMIPAVVSVAFLTARIMEWFRMSG